MSAVECGHDRAELAMVLLGAVDEVDLDAIDVQLAGCAACAATYEELADLPALLDLITEEATVPPARLRDRVVADLARRAERRRRSPWVVVAMVAALLAGVAIGQVSSPSPTPVVTVAVDAVDPYPAHGHVRFASEAERLVVGIELEGLEPLEGDAAYEAWLYTADHRIVSIGQLDPVDGRVDTELRIAGQPAQFTGFWVTAEPDRREPAHQGPTVVRAPVPRW